MWSHANSSTGKDVQFQATGRTKKTSSSSNANYAMGQSNMFYLCIKLLHFLNDISSA